MHLVQKKSTAKHDRYALTLPPSVDQVSAWALITLRA